MNRGTAEPARVRQRSASTPTEHVGSHHARPRRSGTRLARVIAPLVTGALAVVACSSGDSQSDATTTAASAASTPGDASTQPERATTTTKPPQTTTTTTIPQRRLKHPCKVASKNTATAPKDAGNRAARRAARFHAAAQRDARRACTDKQRVRSTSEPNGKPAPRKPAFRRMPLTGEILGKNESLPKRPAIVVKIDNHPSARPQSGLNSADIVFEEIVEWGTRFAAVFHSNDANPVGPIRSGRTQDINMVGRLNTPLFAWSGGNPGVEAAIAAADVVDLNATASGGGYFRGPGSAPHNLYNTTDALWSQTRADWTQPGQYFNYLEPGESFGGPRAAGVELNLDSFQVWWGWSPAVDAYLRSTNGTPHYDATGGRVRARNIVVLETEYQPSVVDANSPEARTIGSGRAWVFSDGHVRRGKWTREGPNAHYRLASANGRHPIELGPGPTYVELAEVGVDGVPRPLPVP